MIEVEVKVSVNDTDQIEEQLVQIGFLKGDLLIETDYYFDNASNQIRENGMALRIRSSENLTVNLKESFITFKGPKMDKISMTRKERETKIEDAEIGKDILMSLGYMPVQPVIKRRQYFRKSSITACLDQVENLGDFLELEIIVAEEIEKAAALDKIISILQKLGYEQEEIIRTSYLSMLQNK